MEDWKKQENREASMTRGMYMEKKLFVTNLLQNLYLFK